MKILITIPDEDIKFIIRKLASESEDEIFDGVSRYLKDIFVDEFPSVKITKLP